MTSDTEINNSKLVPVNLNQIDMLRKFFGNLPERRGAEVRGGLDGHEQGRVLARARHRDAQVLRRLHGVRPGPAGAVALTERG